MIANRPRPQPLTRLDGVLLVGAFALGLALDWISDVDFCLWEVDHPGWVQGGSRLPNWLRGRREIAIRLQQATIAFVAMSAIGVAICSVRPRRSYRNIMPFGPGRVACCLVAMLGLATLCWLVAEMARGKVPGHGQPRALGNFRVILYSLWSDLSPGWRGW